MIWYKKQELLCRRKTILSVPGKPKM